MVEKCGAETREGAPCERPPMDNGRCYHHGGRSEDDSRNAGGAPEGNSNSTKHFAFRKPEYLEQDIQGTEYEDVFIASFEALCTLHEQRFGDEPNFFFKRRYRRFVLKDIKEDLIDAYLSERQGSSGSDNPLVEQQIEDVDGRMNVEKANKLISKMSDLSREIRLGLKDFGLLNDPQTKQAEAEKSLVEVLKED